MSSSPIATRAAPGAPAGRAVKTVAVSATTKRVLIVLGVATYLGATAAATVYGSAALYMLFHKQRPVGITAGTLSAFWSEYGADPKERKKLQLALMVPPFVLLLLVPMGIAAATQNRWPAAAVLSSPATSRNHGPAHNP